MIIRITNQDERFYPLMGPFLAKRDIEKEIGYKIYDDDGKEWIIDVKDGNVVHGFCYLLSKPKNAYQIGSCYVTPEHRGKGLFGKLLKEAQRGICAGSIQITTRNEILKKHLNKNGFASIRDKGSFTEFLKEVNSDV